MLHRDGLILVIDKPAGLAVHAGPSGAPNLEECFDALRFGLPRPPALAHRLDADTSGVLVLGPPSQGAEPSSAGCSPARHREDLLGRGRGRAAGRRRRVRLAAAQAQHAERLVGEGVGQGPEAVTRYKVLGRVPGMAWLE